MLHIKRLRCERGITQRGLAKAIGRSYVTIQSWEKGVSYPNAESIVDMCHLFGCTPNDLFGWHEEHPGGFDSLSPDERMLLDSYNACDASVRACILTVVKASGAASSFQRDKMTEVDNLAEFT